MSAVWDSLVSIQDSIISKLEATGEEIDEPGMDKFNQPGWVNRVWQCENYRRAHVDVVDMRKERKLYMMHVCVFPHVHSNGPVFGFDVIAGPNKMTGAFCDVSATSVADHEMIKGFKEYSSKLDWKRERELPDWAKQIFSDGMIAAGMVKEQAEIDQISTVVDEVLTYYLENIGKYNYKSKEDAGKFFQNRYAYYQKQNPHTPKTMISLGLDPDDVKDFVGKCLFPELT